MKTVKAYHFVGKTLRDGRKIPRNGVWLNHTGPAVMCESGLHASIHPFDALKYAPGITLCKVELRGIVGKQSDKLVAMERRIVARIDAEPLLREFARKCALDCIHLWDAPQVVIDYLKTGDPKLRAAAETAAGAAAWAAWAAAETAAETAAGAAAWAAAGAAAWAAGAAAGAAQKRRFASMVAKAFKGQ